MMGEVAPQTGLERGTTGYAINFFRRDILVNLQIDLKRAEDTGIDENACKQIKILLSAMVSAASARPRGSLWGPAVHEVLREYEDSYRQWNDVGGLDPGSIARRDHILRSLQDKRQRFAEACRKNTYSLSQAHDLELIGAINDALKGVIRVMPDMFTALAKSAMRFDKRAVEADDDAE